jgi:spore coat protein B
MSNTNNSGLEKSPFDDFIESLIGKVVKINRGGPESKKGILLDYQDDYIALLPEVNEDNDDDKSENKDKNGQDEKEIKQDPVIYFQVKHIKSIIEDSKSNSTQTLENEDLEVDFVQSSNLKGVVTEYKDKFIQINQGGSESKKGLVLEVSDDYIVLFTEDDGVVYFNTQHVKSICESDNNEDENDNDVEKEVKKPMEFLKGDCFHKLFSGLQHKWVSINRGGPEAIEGVLVEVSDGHFTLVSNEEVLRLHPFHIKSLSSGPKGSFQTYKTNDEEEIQVKNEIDEDEQQEDYRENNEIDDIYREKEVKYHESDDINDIYREKEIVNIENDDKEENNRDKSYRLLQTSGERIGKNTKITGSVSKEDVVKTIDYKWSPKRRV